MLRDNFDTKYWDKINRKIKKHHYEGIMSDYKRYAYIRLFKKWHLNIDSNKILVTDLFDEAYNSNNLFYMCNKLNKNVVGADISEIIVKKARINLNVKNIIVCDVRKPPLKNNAFDIILSPSTLDHFPKENLVLALNELASLLNSNGKIIISLHNKLNIFLHFYITKFIKRPMYRLDTYSIKDFKKIIEKTNLNIVKQSAICHMPIPLISGIVFNYVSKIKKTKNFLVKLYKFFENLENTKLKYFTGELLIFQLTKK